MTNILDKTDASLSHLPPNAASTGVTKSKHEHYNWTEIGGGGEFRLVNKRGLNIDGRYQREATSKAKILRIAREWDWLLFGALAIVERVDGGLWVFDGGHRTRASFLRGDVALLPCIVHQVETLGGEARAFYDRNTLVTSVSAVDRHKAGVVGEDPIAIRCQSLLDQYGIHTASHATTPSQIKCLGTLRYIVSLDAELAADVFAHSLGIAIDADEPVSSAILRGIFSACRRFGRDIVLDKYGDRLRSMSQGEITKMIRSHKATTGQGGERAEGIAVMNCINKGLRSRRLRWPD